MEGKGSGQREKSFSAGCLEPGRFVYGVLFSF